MNYTKIEWADRTWNPVTGCLHGCGYCYARRIARRFSHGVWNTVEDGIKHYIGIPMQNEHYKGDRIDPYPYGFDPTFYRYRLDEPQKLKKPQNIFVCSMADLFGEWMPIEWIEDVFNACEAFNDYGMFCYYRIKPNKETAPSKKTWNRYRSEFVYTVAVFQKLI